ncbi:hypothetical protein AKJ39_03245 [candidate division MSBL1 archaeon SCGC-AAA259J03]|uniref:Uncharacterized protein n=1 Tax=candidate division MSBL1 archaeon SCGC-AAA259J03 TaxID=1698269 RepID=A0A656YVS6_9EURY|nr:hypothetical protein AKJ39_03245 [candidate division MSBL1 archaeon SCGC-AAA259J03]
MNVKDEWLREFSSEETRKKYDLALESFAEEVIDGNLGSYLEELRESDSGLERLWDDMKKYYERMSGYAPKTRNARLGTVKVFFQDHDLEIPQSWWKKFRRRKMDKNRPITQDRAGKKKEWRKIIVNIDSPLGKALYLTLLSTGCRIGAMLSVKRDDVDWDSDPVRITLKPEYTKEGIGDRTVFLTSEAEEYVRNYLDWRKGKKKANGIDLDCDRLFPITRSTAARILHNAIDKSDLDIGRDEETEIHEIHTHSTRKFFRSKCGLDDALTHALLGHKGYLDRSYLRVDPDRAAEEFKEIEDNLTILEPENARAERRARESAIGTLEATLKVKGIKESEIEEAIHESEVDLGEVLSQAETDGSAAGNTLLDCLDFGTMSEGDFQEVKQALMKLLERGEQKVIDEAELEDHINDGWRFVDSVGESKAVVER